ncbi:efflux RND transporter permease subunit [Methylomonas sp. CM2]|uniref:efflux RND transporter permease subunit n=1 Tax=Methylomonas sp. CM2 TaxID=3417647 RepID=UPI003CEA165C
MEKLFDSLNGYFAGVPTRVIRFKWWILLSTLALTLFLLFGALTRTSINTAANSFLDRSDPAIVALDKFRRQFGSDDSVFLVYRAKDGDVFSRRSLAALQTLTDDLENWRELGDKVKDAGGQTANLDELRHIRRVQSLSNLRVQSADGDTLHSNRLVPRQLPDNPAELAEIKAQALAQKDYRLAFYSPDGQYAAVLIQTDFGAIPVKDYVPKVNADGVALDDSFGDVASGAETLKFDDSAEVQAIQYEKVDNFVYARFVKALKAVYQRYDNDFEFYSVGYPPLMEFVQQVLQQSAGLNLGMILINVVLLWVLFRSFSAVLWPVLIVLFSIVWVTGAAAWAGKSLSTMISLTVMLVFVCCMADCIHVISIYQARRQQGDHHRQALSDAYATAGLPMLITSITNMTGTFSLISSELYPIRVFAAMSTLGVGLAYLFSVLLLPILLDFWHPGVADASVKPGWPRRIANRWLALSTATRSVCTIAYVGLVMLALGFSVGGYIALISVLTYAVIRGQKRLLSAVPRLASRQFRLSLLLFGVLVAACWYGESRLRIDSNVTELTREGSAIRVAYQTADGKMAGTQNMEIMLDTKTADGILDPKILTRIDSLQQKIAEKYPDKVSRTYSLANLVKDTYRVLNEDRPEFYRIPDSQTMVAQLLYLFNSVNPADRRGIVSDDYSQSHISVNVYSAGSSQYQAFFDEVNREIEQVFGDVKNEFPDLEVTLTGTVPLAMRTQAIIAHSQYDGFLLALGVISVIIFLTLGSVQAGLLSLIPNVIPALFTYGLMGLLDIPLDTDTLLLAPVIIGLAVDDTIHFMTHYRQTLIKTRHMAEALRETIEEVGPSILFTGMVLGLGFSIQGFSDYLGTAKMGIFGGLAIFVGILCELFLLPALLVAFKPKFGLKQVDTTVNL